jgi:hypothetical protein
VWLVFSKAIGPQLYVDGKAHTASVGSIDRYILLTSVSSSATHALDNLNTSLSTTDFLQMLTRSLKDECIRKFNSTTGLSLLWVHFRMDDSNNIIYACTNNFKKSSYLQGVLSVCWSKATRTEDVTNKSLVKIHLIFINKKRIQCKQTL